MSSEKNILVIGGSGFVGRNMVEYFSNSEGYVVDSPSHAVLDALDEDAVRSFLGEGQYDVVLNCLDQGVLDSGYLENRLRMFSNLSNNSSLYGKMIYFGTGAEYARHLPMKRVREDDVGRAVPKDTYGLCMFEENEIACRSQNIINLKLFGIFGKHERWQTRFISNAICKALYGYPITIRQDRIMDYLHIDDLQLITEWVVNSDPVYKTYNATSGMGISLYEIAKKVVDYSGADIPIYIANEGMAPEYTSSNARLISEFDFTAEPIDVSIAKLFNYYKRNLSLINKEYLLYQ